MALCADLSEQKPPGVSSGGFFIGGEGFSIGSESRGFVFLWGECFGTGSYENSAGAVRANLIFFTTEDTEGRLLSLTG